MVVWIKDCVDLFSCIVTKVIEITETHYITQNSSGGMSVSSAGQSSNIFSSCIRYISQYIEAKLSSWASVLANLLDFVCSK